MVRSWLLVLLLGCGRIGFDPFGTTTGDAELGDGNGPRDSAIDARPCSPAAPQPITTSGLIIGSAGHTAVAVAVNADRIGLLYPDTRMGGFGDLFLQLHDLSGAPIGSATRLTTTTGTAESNITLVARPTGGFAAFWNGTIVEGVLVDPDGTVGAVFRVRDPSADAEGTSMIEAFDTGAGFTVLTSDDRLGSSPLEQSVFMSRVDYSGQRIGSDVPLTTTPFGQLLAAAFHDDELAFVTYTDSGTSRFHRRALDGAQRGTDTTIVSALGGVIDSGLVWSGSGYVSSYAEGGTMARVVVLDPQGVVTGPSILVGSGSSIDVPDVDRVGDELLVAWRNNIGGPSYRRIAADGTLLGPVETIASPASNNIAVATIDPGVVMSWNADMTFNVTVFCP